MMRPNIIRCTKFLFVAIALMITLFCLTSCGKNYPVLTDEESTAMGNFMSQNNAILSDGSYYGISFDYDGDGRASFIKRSGTGTTGEVELMGNCTPYYINEFDDHIFFLAYDYNESIELYDFDEKEYQITKLRNGSKNYLQLQDYHLYYTGYDENSGVGKNLYSCNLYGEDEVLVMEKEMLKPYVVKDYVYYIAPGDGSIHVYNIKSKEDMKVTGEQVWHYILNGNNLYYTSCDDSDNPGMLIKYSMKTGEEETLYSNVKMGAQGTLAYYEGRLYFADADDKGKIYSISTSGENVKIMETDAENGFVGGIKIYEDALVYTTYYEYTNEGAYMSGLWATYLDDEFTISYMGFSSNPGILKPTIVQ